MLFPAVWKKEHYRKILPVAVVLAILLLSTASPIQRVEAAVLFSDGFETGEGAWTGKGGTADSSVYVENGYPEYAHDGMVYAVASLPSLATTTQNAYYYKSVSAAELYVRGYFTMLSVVDMHDGDRCFYIVLKAGDGNSIAYGGFRVVGGIAKWCLTLRQGTGYVNVYSSKGPVSIDDFDGWYCIELHWRKGTTTGGADLWVNGEKVCSSWNKNTANYGDVKSVRVGIAEAVIQPNANYYEISVRSDGIKISTTYVGVDPQYFLKDGFGSGNFNAWTGTGGTTGEARSISYSIHHHGATSAKFTTDGGGGYESSYCYKRITNMPETYARAYIYVSKSGIVHIGDRLFFIVFRDGTGNFAYAGWKKMSDGTVRWCVTVKTYDGYYDLFRHASGTSLPSPVVGRWYRIEFSKSLRDSVAWLSVNGQPVFGLTGGEMYGFRYEELYGRTASTILCGLPETYGVAASTVYIDCCMIDNEPIGME